MTASLFSPANRRDVVYHCPTCDIDHTTDVPAAWPRRKRRLTTMCPGGHHVTVDLPE